MVGDETGNTNLSLQHIKVSRDLEALLVEIDKLERLSKGRVLHTTVCVSHELVKAADKKMKELNV